MMIIENNFITGFKEIHTHLNGHDSCNNPVMLTTRYLKNEHFQYVFSRNTYFYSAWNETGANKCIKMNTHF